MSAQIGLTWCGYDWQCCMEGGRLIHPDKPWVWYNKEDVILCPYTNPMILRLDSSSCPNKIKYWDGREFEPQYSGGLIRSVDTFSFGTFSAEIILPKGEGLWPAFWLCGEGPWPDCGEIDIMEGYTDNNCLRLTTPYFPWINPSWTTTTNVHYKFLGEHKDIKPKSVSIFKQPHNPDNNWIKYEAKWTPEEIVFKVDGKVVRRDTEAVTWFSKPERRMRVIFDCLCLDPKENELSIDRPMYIRNFKYQPL